ncbi:AraC family transcriptional regulator [Cognatishimia activa]|uniref:AraC family transcriptional regulator n=1 Tax=Cognatishimia activa TaxID=1715691 RepID=UPI00222F39E9|nr:AraC family transcriptional regulator [Cognatishimia activa]UZD89956.1 AraC family transcriptional regulator [Cognatishimia activa]
MHRATQRHRINRVINFISEHHEQDLCLDELADVACLSRFHFTRSFAQHCQETPMAFLARTRLERAASKLIFAPQQTITSIGMDAGFSSSEAFSHAFHRRFGLGPRRFRKANLWGVRDLPTNQIHSYGMLDPAQIYGHVTEPWPVSLRRIPEMRVAYVRHQGPYFNAKNPTVTNFTLENAFDVLMIWAKETQLWRHNSKIFGLCPNNPSLTPPELCHYDVCLPVDDDIEEDEVVSIRYLPEMTVATLEVTGSSNDLMQAWQWLIDTWIPSQNLEMLNHAAFEICHAESHRLRCPSEGITLCMPVIRKRAYSRAA